MAEDKDLLAVHRFTAEVKGSHVEFQVIQLSQSFFLWVSCILFNHFTVHY